MSPRRKISTEARLDAIGVLVRQRPRLSIVKAAEMVEGAASLIIAGQPRKVAEAMFAAVRPSEDELSEVFDELLRPAVSNVVAEGNVQWTASVGVARPPLPKDHPLHLMTAVEDEGRA